MDRLVELWIPALPVAQPRPRAFNRGGKAATIVSAPSDHPVHAFKATCAMVARRVWGRVLIDHPIALDIVFVFPRTKRDMRKSAPIGRLDHGKKPDADNLAKAVTDALNGVLWRDDSLVDDLRARKVVAAIGEEPHVEVYVRKIT